MKINCDNCGNEIATNISTNNYAYVYNTLVMVNGKVVRGNNLIMCSRECCCEYDKKVEQTKYGFMCIRMNPIDLWKYIGS